MNDFQTALLKWKSSKRLLCKEIAQMLYPAPSVATVSSWIKGTAEPKKGHRAQLVKLSKGTIKPVHFL